MREQKILWNKSIKVSPKHRYGSCVATLKGPQPRQENDREIPEESLGGKNEVWDIYEVCKDRDLQLALLRIKNQNCSS